MTKFHRRAPFALRLPSDLVIQHTPLSFVLCPLSFFLIHCFSAPNIHYPASSIQYPASSIQYPAPSNQHLSRFILLPDAVKIGIFAGWAMCRPAGTDGFLPFVIATAAMKKPSRVHQLIIAPFDINRFAMDQGIRNRFASPLNDTTERSAGNPHVSSGFLVGHAQEIGKADGLALVNGQANFLKIKHGYAPGLEVADFRIKCDPAFFLRSNHRNSFMRIFSKTET